MSAAKRGGSWMYCQMERTLEVQVPRLNKLGHKTKYTINVRRVEPCTHRVKINKPRAMQRHMRRVHSDA